MKATLARLALVAALVLAGARRPESGTACGLEDLPLVEVQPAQTSGDLLAIVISGDGGWARIDRELASALAARGMAVVGLDGLRYFWTRRTPDESARTLERIARHYLEVWKRQRLLLIGYSRGAEVLPFMASRLPGPLRARTALVALLAPARSTTFELHLADWAGSAAGRDALPTLPEVEKLRGTRILCVYGEEEAETLCTLLEPDLARLEKRPGGHHFDRDYAALAERIADAAQP